MLPGSLVSAVVYGAHDIGVVTTDDVIEQTRRICRCSALALIVDGEDGFGGPGETAELVGALGEAGAAAVTIEDTRPIRGSVGKQDGLVGIAEVSAKILAARQAQSRAGPAIVARTGAPLIMGMSDTLERAAAYGEAGADMLFLIGLQDWRQLHEVRKHCPLPLMLGGPGLAFEDPQELAAAGVRVRIVRHGPLPTTLRALLGVYEASAVVNAALTGENDLIDRILLWSPGAERPA